MLKQRIHLKWYVDCPFCDEEFQIKDQGARDEPFYPVTPEKCPFCEAEFLLNVDNLERDKEKHSYRCDEDTDDGLGGQTYKRGKIEELVLDNLSDLQISLIYDTIKSKK